MQNFIHDLPAANSVCQCGLFTLEGAQTIEGAQSCLEKLHKFSKEESSKSGLHPSNFSLIVLKGAYGGPQTWREAVMAMRPKKLQKSSITPEEMVLFVYVPVLSLSLSMFMPCLLGWILSTYSFYGSLPNPARISSTRDVDRYAVWMV